MDVKVFLMIIYFCWQGHPTSLESLPWSNYCILLWVRGDFTFGLTVQFLTLSSMTKILFHRSCGNSGSYMWRLKKKIRCPGGNYRKWLSPYKQCGFSRQKIIIRHQKNRKLSRGAHGILTCTISNGQKTLEGQSKSYRRIIMTQVF